MDVAEEEPGGPSFAGSPEGDRLFGGSELEHNSPYYEPSLLPTDFSETLPCPSFEQPVALASNYNVDAVVNSAWNSLRSDVYKLPWETDFWNQFLDPGVTGMEQMARGVKRPMSTPAVTVAEASDSAEVDRRVSTKTFPLITSFLQHIKDVPERSWQEERESLWETGIRRWVALVEQWHVGDSVLLQSLHNKRTFTEKAQILGDVFYNKAPQTLIKRANSLNSSVEHFER